MTTETDQAADLVRAVTEKLNAEPQRVWVLHSHDVDGDMILVYDSLANAQAQLSELVQEWLMFEFRGDNGELSEAKKDAIERLKQDPNTWACEAWGQPWTMVIHPLDVLTQ